MLKRPIEVTAVLVLMIALMAGGAALYAWLAPEKYVEQPVSRPAEKTPPTLSEAQVHALVVNYSRNAQHAAESNLAAIRLGRRWSCVLNGAKNSVHDDGLWTVKYAGDCGLLSYFVDDVTGEVSLDTSVPTPTSVPALLPPPTPTIDPRLIEGWPTVDPKHAELIGFLEDYLTKSSELRIQCLNSAELTIVVFATGGSNRKIWSIRAKNDEAARKTWNCPIIHSYQVDEWSGKVVRIQ